MLCDELTAEKKVIGINQTKKAILNKTALKVFVAADADESMSLQIISLCSDANIPCDKSMSMEELGRACSIEVKCGTCALLK